MLNNNWNKPTKKYKDEDLIHLSLQALRIHIADHQSVRWFACSQMLHTYTSCFNPQMKTLCMFLPSPADNCRVICLRGELRYYCTLDKNPCLAAAGTADTRWRVWQINLRWSQLGEERVWYLLILGNYHSVNIQLSVAILFHWSPYFQYLLTIVTINKSQCRLFVTI